MVKIPFGNPGTILRLALAATLVFLMSTLSPAVFAQAVRHASDFNHMKTGFPLTGVHVNVECETCHVGGIFKGTPTDCAGCHSPGRRVVAPAKTANHVITNAPCETCHSNTVTFMGARFNHIGVQPRACITCHNGGMGPGKPGAHVVTNSPCDSCHRSSAWIPAGYDHVGVVPGSCSQCHNNVTAVGKPSFHVATTGACDSCHTTGFTSFLGAHFDHIQFNVIPGQCGTCHGGASQEAKPKPAGHIPTTGNDCDTCHNNTGYVSFANSPMNHAAVISTPCATCHSGSYTTQGTLGAYAKPPSHIVTTAACNNCHYSYTTFTGAVVHSAQSAGICGTCHYSGGPGKGLSTGHIPTSPTGNACDSCHANFISFTGAAMNHTAVASARCDTCHNGAYTSQGTLGAQAKTSISNHIPTTITDPSDCNTCHTSTTSFAIEKMNHNGSTTGCKTCHNSGTSYQGSMDKKTLGNHEGSKTTDDCSQSGCHRPLGPEGTAYSRWTN